MIEGNNRKHKPCHTIDAVMFIRANNFYDLWIQADVSAGPHHVVFALQHQ